MPPRLPLFIFAAASVVTPPSPALAWDCHGHRAITLLGLDGLTQLSPDLPPFLKDESSRMMAASNACNPDRYRAIKSGYMAHENNPDHYLDVEKLLQFGLTLDTVPPLRNEYLKAMVIAKHEHPDRVDPYNQIMDPARQQEWPGFGLHAVMEHHAKLTADFKTWRILTQLNEPAREPELTAARANILFDMGCLSHFVGDLAQPLHTTTHHHGWIGDNPDGFTTERKFHSYIDGDILITHRLEHDTLAPLCTFDLVVDVADPWKAVIAHVQRSHDQVRPLYAMQKSGELEGEPGKALIEARLCDGGRTLAALYTSAWKASEISENDTTDFVRFDRWGSVKDQPIVPPLQRKDLAPLDPNAPEAPASKP